MRWLEWWRGYKYRFVPWLTFNLKNRTVREVPSIAQDSIIPTDELLHSLTTFIGELHKHDQKACDLNKYSQREANLHVMKEFFGYQVERRSSLLSGGGQGLFVTSGEVPRGSLVALYPGCIYWPHEPILFQSISNQFVFRCVDGLLIDGNDRSISKHIFRSSGKRDQIGPFFTCDMSWLDNLYINPLAIGQYANNASKMYPANVAYQELDILFKSIPIHLLKYIPNVWYGAENIAREESFIRTIALVSTRTIREGEEVLSSYFTVIH
ncbi:SET domain-containing protein 9-like [Exaiptasia diaphana]|uniref:SET domain-containing protein n=1 Tax=Exaiptasia diaphana TaxID=2652724 RepID=A0A913WNV8_EXADI|nr:SET domain-containing protein 9-like [Exaiptasia diaphana]